MGNFEWSLNHVLDSEGGYSNDAEDSGGPTKFGITIADLKRFRKKTVTESDVKKMTIDEAKEIYFQFYWQPLGLDQLNSRLLSYLIFDQGVNRGIVTAARQIQKLIGVEADGKIGPVTAKKINSTKDEKKLAIDFFKKSQLAYAEIVRRKPNQSVFIVGWLNRTHKLLDIILKGE